MASALGGAVLMLALLSALVVPAALSAAPTADWTLVATPTGFGLSRSAPFEIGTRPWRVTVSTTDPPPPGSGSLIRVDVYQQGEQAASVVRQIQTTIPGRYGEELDAGPGQYFLQVSAPGVRWTIQVEELRQPAPDAGSGPRLASTDRPDLPPARLGRSERSTAP